MRFYIALVSLLAPSFAIGAAHVPQTTLAVQVSVPSVPPGATTQIRLTLTAPHQIASGRVVMDLDPTIFGPITAVDVFSATGDQVGTAQISDRHADTHFSSSTGGIGQVASLPILTVTVPVLATAASGASTPVTFSTSATAWKDPQGNQYLPSPQPTQMKVGGALSIQSVAPGGGLLPAGTTVHITGTGFTAATVIQIDGVVLASSTFISAQAIDIAVGAPVDLTAKRVVVRNSDGSQVDFYSALHAAMIGSSAFRPIFPQQTYTNAGVGDTVGGYALQNQTAEPVVVQLTYFPEDKYAPAGSDAITIPPYTAYVSQQGGPASSVSASSPTPIQMMGYGSTVRVIQPQPPQLSIYWPGPLRCENQNVPLPASSPACYPWLVGSSPPSLTLNVQTSENFTVSVATDNGGNWLTVSPTQGAACVYNYPSTTCPTLTVKVDPSSLAVGDHLATITATATAGDVAPSVVSLTFRVTRSLISVSAPPFIDFVTDQNQTPPAPISFQVTSIGDPAPFTITGPGSWASVTPSSGTTPATVTITADPTAVSAGQPGPAGNLIVSGPANSLSFIAALIVRTPTPPPTLTASPSSVTIWSQFGSSPPAPQSIGVSPYPPDHFVTTTEDGANWLIGTPAGAGFSVSVDPSGLASGTYHGRVTASATAHSDYGPAQLSVTLVVWAHPPALSATPSTVELSLQTGSSSGRIPFALASGGLLVDSKLSVSTHDGNAWLTSPYYNTISISAQDLPPSTYHGEVLITGPSGSPKSVTVPVTLHVTPATVPLPQPGPPLGVSILNSASQTGGAMSPGELLTIFGPNIGPQNPATFTPDANGNVPTNLSGTRILFGEFPAPILYASPTRVDTVVPFEIAGRPFANITAEFNGSSAVAAGVPAASSSPAIFTGDGSGVGQAQAVNQNGSANTAANAAARGSTITLTVTGVGQLTPAVSTGAIAPDAGAKPTLPLSVTIGSVDAPVVAAGSAPGQVEGVIQVRVVIPQSTVPGAAVPVVLHAGAGSSPAGATIAVR